jgi:hypothetical protein
MIVLYRQARGPGLSVKFSVGLVVPAITDGDDGEPAIHFGPAG